MADQVVRSVVTEVDNDGVAGESRFLQPLKYVTNEVIVFSDCVIVLGDDGSIKIILGIVGRDRDGCWVDLARLREIGGVVLTPCCLDLTKKGLVLAQFFPWN